MSYETKKANKRRKKMPLFKDKAFVGKGIDIGCGKDILDRKVFKKITSIEGFELADGNAQYIHKHKEKESYDFVYSSNCLEHMDEPLDALRSWYSLVKLGGYLIFTVPDEDLYEQGVFPSRYNYDHKWTFTIYKEKSWSEKSINIVDLVRELFCCKVHRITVVDTNYDYTKFDVDQTQGKAEAFIEVLLQKTKGNNA
jgi:SAM-dependent methyltransferase